jgi:hypothetical protein
MSEVASSGGERTAEAQSGTGESADEEGVASLLRTGQAGQNMRREALFASGRGEVLLQREEQLGCDGRHAEARRREWRQARGGGSRLRVRRRRRSSRGASGTRSAPALQGQARTKGAEIADEF